MCSQGEGEICKHVFTRGGGVCKHVFTLGWALPKNIQTVSVSHGGGL